MEPRFVISVRFAAEQLDFVRRCDFLEGFEAFLFLLVVFGVFILHEQHKVVVFIAE